MHSGNLSTLPPFMKHTVIQNNLIIFSALLTKVCAKLKRMQLFPGQGSYWFIQTICTHVVTQLSSQNNSWLCCLVKSFHQTWCAAAWFVIFLTLSKQTVLSPADVLLSHSIKKVQCIMRNVGFLMVRPKRAKVEKQSVNLFRFKRGKS